MHPFVLNVFRFLITIMTLFVIVLLQNKNELNSLLDPFRKHIWLILGLGFLGYFFYQIFFILGIAGTTAGNCSLIMASSPAWTALIGILFTNERLRPLAWFGLFLSIAGTTVIVLTGKSELSTSSEYLAGNLSTVAAAACWGAYTAFSRKAAIRIDPVQLTLYGLLPAFPFIVCVALPYFNQTAWAEVGAYSWLSIIYSGGLSTGIAVVIWTFAVRRVGATHTAIYANLVPVVALLGSYLILNEFISLGQLLGGSLILGGLLLMRYDRRMSFFQLKTPS